MVMSINFLVDVVNTSTYVPVAQLDRAFACGAKGRRFESCRAYQNQKKTPEESYFDPEISDRFEPKVRTPHFMRDHLSCRAEHSPVVSVI